jgi:hypothetical protein
MDWISSEGAHLLTIYNGLPITTRAAVTLLIVVGVIVHVFKYNEQTVHDGPSLFTTAGILFTFIGIAEGLYDFDPKHIDESVPHLLDGLKTAFIASVFGVGIALSIKLRFTLFGIRKTEYGQGEDATVSDLVRQLADVRTALTGSEDGSVVSQLKLARQDTNDRLDQLNRSQKEFLANAAENNSKALIQALESVIRDFNSKISEQFGENFKHLNLAIGRLLEWQERYRVQIEELISQQSRTTQNMQIVSERYETIVSKSEDFSKVANSLSSLLSALQNQRDQIQTALTSLGEVLSKTADGLPKLEFKITELTEQMTFGVKAHQEQIADTLTQGTKAITDTIGDVRRLVLDATQAANQAINTHMSELAAKTNEQIVKLDAALEDELQKSLSSLGTQLTSLSKRFVDDYTPLTQRLVELLGVARAAQ